MGSSNFTLQRSYNRGLVYPSRSLSYPTIDEYLLTKPASVDVIGATGNYVVIPMLDNWVKLIPFGMVQTATLASSSSSSNSSSSSSSPSSSSESSYSALGESASSNSSSSNSLSSLTSDSSSSTAGSATSQSNSSSSSTEASATSSASSSSTAALNSSSSSSTAASATSASNSSSSSTEASNSSSSSDTGTGGGDNKFTMLISFVEGVSTDFVVTNYMEATCYLNDSLTGTGGGKVSSWESFVDDIVVTSAGDTAYKLITSPTGLAGPAILTLDPLGAQLVIVRFDNVTSKAANVLWKTL